MSFYLDDDVLTTAFMQTTELIDRYISVDNVWVVGQNNLGQLGLSDIVIRSTFTIVPGLSNLKDIAVGQNHTIALKTDGTVWTVGENGTYGQLGLSDIVNRSTFTSVPGLNNVKAISNGFSASMVLKNDGTLWTVGRNTQGQLGLSDVSHRSIFTSVPGLNNVKRISNFGYFHMTILKNDGTVWGCGYNGNGQLGLSYLTSRSTFTSVPGLTNIKSISGGYNHSVALKTDGTVWVCGRNAEGQLGLSDLTDRSIFTSVPGLSNVKAIAGGFRYSTLVLNYDGTVSVVGLNNTGQLGLSDLSNRSTFTQVPMMSNVKTISCGNLHTLTVKTDGTIWAVGQNSTGQLGLSDLTDRSTFTSVPVINNVKSIVGSYFHTVALQFN